MKPKIIAAAAAAAVMLSSCGDSSKMDKLIEQQTSSVKAADESSAADTSTTDGSYDDSGTENGWYVGDDYSPLESGEELSSVKSFAELKGIEAANDGFDIDLTILDATMTYAQVFDMVYNPDLYKGKLVRAEGSFSHLEENGKDYYAVIIADATACCAQGIEFVLDGDFSYPEDYPEEGEEFTVWGTLTSYEEGGYTYLQLQNAEMKTA